MTGYEPPVRTYGGWRLARGIGILGAGAGGSMLLLGAWSVSILMGAANIVWYAYLGPPTAALSAAILLRWDNETLATKTIRRLRWWWASVSRYTDYSQEDFDSRLGIRQLPSLLAPTRLLEIEDGQAQRFGLVHDQRSGLLTATLRCDARSTALVDTEQADRWVASWGSWLADLGSVPMVAWVAATVETAPETGSALAEAIAARIDPDAPADAQQLLVDLLERSPRGAADVDTRVSITFNPAAALVPLRELDDQVAEVSRLLTSLESSLGECGVAVLGRCTASELAGVVTMAFRPELRGEVNRALATPEGSPARQGLNWEDSGPTGAHERWDRYLHSGGCSVSYGWGEAPRQQVSSGVLGRLLAPGRFAKRVTVLYRSYSAAEAASQLEQQVNAVMFRQGFRSKRGLDERARDQADREAATLAAREEAHGAGLVRMSLYATTTVTEPGDMEAACADLEARAQQCKIRLKRLLGSQAAGFAYTLPVGVHPVEMMLRGRR